MKLHLHIGPGHHDRILREQIEKYGISYTFSEHHPKFHYSVSEGKNKRVLHISRLFEFVNWLVWGLTNRISVLRKYNRHYMITYPLYDKLASNHINEDCELLFCWPQVSLSFIKKAKNKKKIVVLDYPIPHVNTWQRLLQEEAKRNGVVSPHSLFSKSMAKRMNQEIELADLISVPSEFVKESFLENNVPESKLIFNSYGISTKRFTINKNKSVSGRLKVVFVGSIEFRKGVQYLLNAFQKLPADKFELKLIGTVHRDFDKIADKYRNLENVNWLGQLAKDDTAKELRSSDVMVMPSILEGLSLTILESMASGTPVISTTNAGGVGVIDNEDDGWVIPIRDPEEIVKRLQWCADNREEVIDMGKKARQKILGYYDVDHYGNRFIEKVYSLVN